MEKKMKAINVAKVPVVLIAMILMLRGIAFGQGDEFIRERAWAGSFAGGTSVMDRAHSEMYQTVGTEII